MIRRRTLTGFFITSLAVLAAATLEARADLPVVDGTWELTIGGKGGGIAYVTFDTIFVTGYGITGDYILPFSLTGTNSGGSAGLVVSGASASLSGSASNNFCEVLHIEESNNIYGTNDLTVGLTGQLKSSEALDGTFTNIRSSYPVKGARPAALADLSGTWGGDVKSSTLWPQATVYDNDLYQCVITPLTAYKKSILVPETWTLTPTTDRPGSFDISGTGAADTNSFVLTGTLLVSSKNKVFGFMQRDFGEFGVVLYTFTGKVNAAKGTFKLKGIDTHHGTLGKISGLLTRP